MKYKPIIILYIFISFLFLTYIVANFYGYSFYQILYDKLFRWFWVLCTASFIVFYWRFKVVKRYLYGLLLILVLSIVPLGIPFLGILHFFYLDNPRQSLVVDKQFCIERKIGVMAVDFIIVKKRYGFLEKKIAQERTDIILNNPPNTTKDKLLKKVTFVGCQSDTLKLKYEFESKTILFKHDLKK